MTHYKLGLVCRKNASAVCQAHLKPSSAMATRAASHPQKEAPMNHFHQPNLKCKVCQISINTSKTWMWTEDWKGDWASIKLTHWGYPHPTSADPDGRSDGGLDICQTNTLGTPPPLWHGLRWRTRHPSN